MLKNRDVRGIIHGVCFLHTFRGVVCPADKPSPEDDLALLAEISHVRPLLTKKLVKEGTLQAEVLASPMYSATNQP